MKEYKPTIYLDNNATTVVDKEVLGAMLPYFTTTYGNAASKTHPFGWQAEAAVDKARQQIAGLIHSEPNEIIFTSGATEGINLALQGVHQLYTSKGKHIVTVATEHKAVLDCCEFLEQERDAEITYLGVDENGLINLQNLEKAIRPDTILVAVMLVNNETGVIQPIKAIAEIVHAKGSMLLSDCTQAIGKVAVDVQELGIDIMPVSAHKCYGPKGVGALYLRRRGPRVSLAPLFHGGGHEKGLRPGTLNVPGIVGLGKACELANDLEKYTSDIAHLRDQLEKDLLAIDGAVVNGSTKNRAPNTTNISFIGTVPGALIKALSDKVAVSSGSACTSAIMEPSYVLKAMGVSDEDAYTSVRFSLSKHTTKEEIDATITAVKQAVKARMTLK